MNSDIMRSKWTEIGGEIKERWTKMSDYDVMEANGDPERIIDLLQRRYGLSGRGAREALGEVLRRYVDNSKSEIPEA